jgi:AAA domain
VHATGGLGKSTLANQIYTEMKEMEVFSKESSKYVTFDFDSAKKDNDKVGEVQRWLTEQKGPVLLLLDNVQRQHQLESIYENVKDKSFVLITSCKRDLRLVAPSYLYDMPIMDYSDALNLFQRHLQGPGTAGVSKTRSLQVSCTVRQQFLRTLMADSLTPLTSSTNDNDTACDL